jgi:hypothetical protein
MSRHDSYILEHPFSPRKPLASAAPGAQDERIELAIVGGKVDSVLRRSLAADQWADSFDGLVVKARAARVDPGEPDPRGRDCGMRRAGDCGTPKWVRASCSGQLVLKPARPRPSVGWRTKSGRPSRTANPSDRPSGARAVLPSGMVDPAANPRDFAAICAAAQPLLEVLIGSRVPD